MKTKSRNLSNRLKDIKQLVVNGSLRPNATQKAISNDIKPDLWPKVSLRDGVLIIRRPSLMYPRKTHLESL